MLKNTARFCGLGLAIALAAYACSSDDSSTPTPTGGSTSSGTQGGAGGSSTSSSSTTSAGGASTGASGSTGVSGAGGGSTGGAGGSGGSAGSGGGTSKDGGGGSPDGGREGGGSDAATAMMLTSSAFMEGGMIPAANTCASGAMGNNSPPLMWTPGPASAQSYAIVLTDRNNNLVHWVLWDIPATTTSLPANLPKTSMLTMPAGAKQNAFSATGYVGPCPSGQLHTYEFAVYAINVAMLPGMSTTASQTATRANATVIMSHQLAKGTLTGQSNASAP
jgi:Raf kinase inhibitor-like YbhB/YbcL family protein